jgi:hypothetical protein
VSVSERERERERARESDVEIWYMNLFIERENITYSNIGKEAVDATHLRLTVHQGHKRDSIEGLYRGRRTFLSMSKATNVPGFP